MPAMGTREGVMPKETTYGTDGKSITTTWGAGSSVVHIEGVADIDAIGAAHLIRTLRRAREAAAASHSGMELLAATLADLAERIDRIEIKLNEPEEHT